ncbi:MAG: winged helix-turn-helix transcriptional regulator [Candidatus Thorarchaeota archaeon]
MVSKLDPLDWALICELCGNARMPYKALAKKFNISTNTVKNRINRLRKQGVIRRFGVCVSFETFGAENVAGFVITDGSENAIEFMKKIASQPMVAEVYRTSDRRYEYHAIVLGASETLGFKRFLSDLDGVINVEMRPIEFFFPNKPPNYVLNTRGKRVTFTREQLRVLKSLAENDSRLPVSQIVQYTGFTPRRVRRILRDLEESGGVHFPVYYDVFALGDMEYRMRICYDESQTTGQDIIIRLYEKYPGLFWWASITTNESIVDVGLIIDRPGKGPPIAAEIKAAAYTESVEDFVSYPRVVPGINRLNVHLWDLIHEAGL